MIGFSGAHPVKYRGGELVERLRKKFVSNTLVFFFSKDEYSGLCIKMMHASILLSNMFKNSAVQYKLTRSENKIKIKVATTGENRSR